MPAEAAPPAMPRPIGAVALAALTGNGSAAAGPHALFDVREPGEAHRGHVFGATCLPLRLLEFRIAELVRDPATPIVVYDDATGRAQQAAATLAALGYRDVAWLDGGIDAWRAAGQRPATGNNVPSKRFGETVHAGFHVPAITPAELQQWRRAGRDVVVCDVRTPEEYAESCIPGAFVGAGFDLVQGAAGLARRHEVVVVNCAGRTRSIIAARTLAELGVANVVALENGTMGWRLAGLEVETGAGRELDPPSPADLDEARRASRALADAAGIARCDAAALAGLLAEPHRNRYVLDVRRVADYVRGHVPGSLALPGGQAVQRADDFLCVKSAPVVLVDEHGIQANVAAVWLSRMGYPDVRVLEGGLPAARWRRARRATGRRAGPPRLPPRGPCRSRRARRTSRPTRTRWSSTWERAAPFAAGTCPARPGCRAAGSRRASTRWPARVIDRSSSAARTACRASTPVRSSVRWATPPSPCSTAASARGRRRECRWRRPRCRRRTTN